MKKIGVFLFLILMSLSILSACGESEAHEHQWEEMNRVNATCIADGKITYICHGCDETKDVVFEEKTGHTVVTDNAVSPTCTSTGLTEGSHCSICNQVICTQEVVDKLNHNYSLGICTHCSEPDPDYKIEVQWLNYNGYVLEIDEDVPYNTVPEYNGETPFKESDQQYSYVFVGWDMELDPVIVSTIYVAQFEAVINKYTITWQDWDGSILKVDENIEYLTYLEYDGPDLEREGNAQYSYSFSGWGSNYSPIVTGDAVYTAHYYEEVNTYTISWNNWNGTILSVQFLDYGDMPEYRGSTPYKFMDDQYIYEFSGWSPEVEIVKGDATYTAQFTEITRSYTVKWLNYDNTVLEYDLVVEYGTVPTYDGLTPTKAGDAQYSYRFTGWNYNIVPVTGDQVYTAQYETIVNKYTIKWCDYNGTVLSEKVYSFGEMPVYEEDDPSRENDDMFIYTFTGWDSPIEEVICDVTYTAQYSQNFKTPTVYEDVNGIRYMYIGTYPQTEYVPESESEKIELEILYDTYGTQFEYNGKTIYRLRYSSGLVSPSTSATKYFIVEPIRWDIIDDSNGVYTVMSHLGLDFKETKYRSVKTGWEDSDIRFTLNNFVYNLTIDGVIPDYILDTVNSNNYESSNIEKTADNFRNEPADTVDKLYFFSYAELNMYKSHPCLSAVPTMSDYAKTVTRSHIYYYNGNTSSAQYYENAYKRSELFYPSRSTNGVGSFYTDYHSSNTKYDAYEFWGLKNGYIKKFTAYYECSDHNFVYPIRTVPLIPVMRIAKR